MIAAPAGNRTNQDGRKEEDCFLNSHINRISALAKNVKGKQDKEIKANPEKKERPETQLKVSGPEDAEGTRATHNFPSSVYAMFICTPAPPIDKALLIRKKGKSGCRLASLEMIF